MIPSTETLATLLALPIEARRLLAERGRGAGVVVQTPHRGRHRGRLHWARVRHPCAVRGVVPSRVGHPTQSPRALAFGSAWLPASEGEILRVWAAKKPYGEWCVGEENCELSWAADGGIDNEARDHNGSLDSRLRAALQCWPGGGA